MIEKGKVSKGESERVTSNVEENKSSLGHEGERARLCDKTKNIKKL